MNLLSHDKHSQKYFNIISCVNKNFKLYGNAILSKSIKYHLYQVPANKNLKIDKFEIVKILKKYKLPERHERKRKQNGVI